MSDLDNIHISFSTLSDNNLISLLQYGDDQFDDTKNKKISMSSFGCFQYLYLNLLLLYISLSDFLIWLFPVLIS